MMRHSARAKASRPTTKLDVSRSVTLRRLHRCRAAVVERAHGDDLAVVGEQRYARSLGPGAIGEDVVVGAGEQVVVHSDGSHQLLGPAAVAPVHQSGLEL